ncbi:DUF1461 domain-containing protein [Candidatus Woesearchaeota archaeon]|nr:DUF1461 domain-containing protein [Candidatus Woesearchaeota archaeon]
MVLIPSFFVYQRFSEHQKNLALNLAPYQNLSVQLNCLLMILLKLFVVLILQYPMFFHTFHKVFHRCQLLDLKLGKLINLLPQAYLNFEK